MIASRRLEDLHPAARRRAVAFLGACRREGIDVLIYCTFRDAEAQAAEYAKGRTAPGRIVTWAKPGESWHQYRLAFDCVPFGPGGKLVWNRSTPEERELWERVGKAGESVGLQWSGRWTGAKRETAHFQFTGGLTLADLQAGRLPAEDA